MTMNVVIYTYNFLPQADAEAFCATRFASALAQRGHNVTVVTMDWPSRVSQSTYNNLVNPKLKIVKVPFSKRNGTKWQMIRYRLPWPEFVKDVNQSIRVLKSVLDQIPDAILMSRAHPLISLVVGWYARKHASKWISHLSDPIPWFGLTSDTFGGRIKGSCIRGWLKKSFRDADATSLTCGMVSRYFHDEYGKVFDNCKCFITTHIGDHSLTNNCLNENETENHVKYLVHPGTTHFDRGIKEVVEAIQKISSNECKIQLIQIGYTDKEVKDFLKEYNFVDCRNSVSAEENVKLCSRANAVFVPDTRRPTTYSPFLLSKFVYQIYSDKPIVLYAMKESPMYELYKKYPNSGIFWAETDNIDALAEAILKAVNTNSNSFDRSAIRKEFDWVTVATEFERNIELLYKTK